MYPNTFKIGRIVPIHKTGDKSKVSNYRPITVLITFNKIFEKLIYARMIEFIETNNLLSENQYGFRKRKNTTTAIMHLLKEVLDTFHDKKVLVALFLDLSKAFDCVEHEHLIVKLERYGFRGIFLDVLSSYLSNRMQYVDVGGAYSNQLDVQYGVPQGSVLGPLLFLIYINDINYIMPELNKVLFADDTVLCKAGHNCNDIIQRMNDEIKILCDWLNSNGLALNENKTKFIVFTRQHYESNVNLQINGVSIEQVKKYKYLGMYIDEKLSFDDHFTCLKGKLSHMCGYFYSIRSLVSINVLKSVYYGLVYPHLLMHIIAWGGAPPTKIRNLQIAQNKIVRCITPATLNLSTVQSYDYLEFENIQEIYDSQALLFFYRWYILGQYVEWNSFLPDLNYAHDYNVRTNQNLRLPLPRLNTDRQSVVYYGITLWNNLPNEIQSLVSYEKYKIAVRRYVCDKQD
jgi:hypothetical protein